MRNRKKEKVTMEHGFTLVELLIAMVVSGFVIAALYSAYVVQQKHALAQEQVSEMQQNIRAGLNHLIREIRLAGFDPDGEVDDSEKIVEATVDSFQYFYVDNDQYSFVFVDNDNENELRYQFPGGGLQLVADNIDALEFYYVLDDESKTTTPSDPKKIRSMEISVLARANQADRNFTNVMTYVPASGDPSWDINGKNVAGTGNPPNDQYRRRLLITSVQLRNMGLAHE